VSSSRGGRDLRLLDLDAHPSLLAAPSHPSMPRGEVAIALIRSPATIPSRDNQVDADVDGRLTALLDRTVVRRGIHHAMFAVAAGDGTRRWSGAAGAADVAGSPLQPETPFFIASVTKRFITTLVLQASERGELGLDDRLVDHLPADVTDGLHVLKGVDHTPAITIRHLLSHTSGLPDYFDKPKAGGASLFRQLAAGHDLAWTFDDVVRMAREEHTPHFPPQDLTAARQRAHYSDTGFQLLIRILEEVTGRPFATLLSERIFTPLGLGHTWLPGRSGPAAPTVAPAPVCAKDRPLELPKMLESSNDLFSATGDLLAFQRALIAGELFDRPATAALLTERCNLLHNMIPNRYGLGTWTFRVNRLAGPGRRPVTLVGHAAVTVTWLFHCPELDLHLAGTIDQSTFFARRAPFQLMAKILRAWHS
jgi:D-alanyl-D-alanine carboxypeptidase